MKRLLLLFGLAMMAGCASYQPGVISKNIFSGLAADGAIVRVPTPYGPAIRIGSTTNSVRVTPDGEVIINERK